MLRENGDALVYPSKRSSRYIERSRKHRRMRGLVAYSDMAQISGMPVRLTDLRRGASHRRQAGPALYFEVSTELVDNAVSAEAVPNRQKKNKKRSLPAGMLHAADCLGCGQEDEELPLVAVCQPAPTHEKVLEALRASISMPELEFHPESLARGVHRLYVPVRHVGWARNLFSRRKLPVEVCAPPADFFSARKSGRSGSRALRKG